MLDDVSAKRAALLKAKEDKEVCAGFVVSLITITNVSTMYIESTTTPEETED